jgi:hypothetical protein
VGFDHIDKESQRGAKAPSQKTLPDSLLKGYRDKGGEVDRVDKIEEIG